MYVKVPSCGQIGVNKDLSAVELPINAWTDAKNVRFLDGYAYQFYGHNEVYNSPSEAPQHVMPCNISSKRYWILHSASKSFSVNNTAGVTTYTDITHATPRTGVTNQWSSTLLSGIPVVTAGDALTVPMYWDLDVTHKFVDLSNWPANTYCKSIKAYKAYLIALNITKGSNNYPFMVKWSHPADPGGLPISWDATDTTKDASEYDLAEGQDPIIDGLQLRNSFMIYKENSIWRMDASGGAYVFNFTKVLGTSGALNRNCIVELDGFHCVLTGSDVLIHDGQSANSVLDKQTRRYLFQQIDSPNISKCFIFKNPFFNEVFICYPLVGSTYCDKAMVWNYVDKTVSFRDIPNLNHAAFGPVDDSLNETFDTDVGTFDSDLNLFDSPGYIPSTTRVMLASANQKLYMLDTSASFDGLIPDAYIERRGLTFDAPDKIKLIRGIRPRIIGTNGDTVLIQVGSSNDPYDDPVYGDVMTHIIGETVSNDCFVSGRYIAIKFSTGTSYRWRLDSFDFDVEIAGSW
jgi:hypothetical protein